MATNATLKAMPRAQHGKSAARKIRASGQVPAVIYGHGVEVRSLTVDALELNRLFSRISVENTVIGLEIEGGPAVRALVREVQSHPYREEILHVDFYQVRAGEQVTVEVPVRIVGTAQGVREGGVLDQVMHSLEVRCRADQIPEAIEVDVTDLGMGGVIHVRDLTLPSGVETTVDGDQPVCSVTQPTVAALGESPEEGGEPAGEGEG